MRYLLFLIPMLVGMGVVVQTGANTQLSAVLDNRMLAALLSFIVGSIGLVIVNLFTGFSPDSLSSENLLRTSWWMWTGGLIGAFFIASVIFIAPQIGQARLFGIIIASQLVFSVIVDHFGWMGFEVQPINLKKIIGVVLLIIGAFLVQWGKEG